jgi:gluconolactonase
VTVLAEKIEGKPLNAPNDAVVAPDGGIWFSDPGYGALFEYEGKKQPLEQKEAVYRIDPATAKIERVTDEIFKPNGLCFSPDYKKLYIADTGSSHYKEAPKNIKVWDVDGAKLKNGREFCSMKMKHSEAAAYATARGEAPPETSDGKELTLAGMADGIRCDVEGNVWVGAGWVGAGYDGVHIFAPSGERIGIILLPEICSNVCFGGPRRNRLFMTASKSLYAVYVETKGAHFC